MPRRTLLPTPGRFSRIPGLPGIVGAALCFAFILPSEILAQSEQPSNVYLEPNEQLFSILAALNAAGYGTSLGAPFGSSFRAEVHGELEERKAAIGPELEKFYGQHRVANDPGADLGQFVSLALLVGPPPDFKLTVAESDLPPDAKSVEGILPLVRTFYKQAELANLWSELRPRYEEQVAQLSSPVRKALADADGYLRFPAGNYLGRTYAIYICLLGAPEQVQARIYGANYYLVLTPSREPKLTEIRHQYLHFLLDPMAVKYAAEIQQKAGLRLVSHQAPLLAVDFKDDFSLLLTECLIRAAELRMDKLPKDAAQKAVNDLLTSGYVLVPYYYEALQEFEKQDASMTVYYKQMVDKIDLKAEGKRLAGVKFTPKPELPKNQAAPALTEEDRLLDEGDNFVFQAKYDEARTAYQTVLEKLDPKSERALYGMAVVYSNLRKPDPAEEYFKKTLESTRDLRLVTWSHIYLARIYDLEGRRQKAMGEYRAASLTAAAYPDALRAVQNGLASPFGSKE